MRKTTILTGSMLTGAVILLSPSGWCATVGSLPVPLYLNNVFGLGEVSVHPIGLGM